MTEDFCYDIIRFVEPLRFTCFRSAVSATFKHHYPHQKEEADDNQRVTITQPNLENYCFQFCRMLYKQ